MHDTESAQISQKQDGRNMHVIMKAMCPHCYHHNDCLYYAPCLACWALFGSLVPAMCNRLLCTQMRESPQSHCGDNWEDTFFSDYMYIKSTLLLWDLRFLCVAYHLLRSFLGLSGTLWVIGTSDV